MHHKNWGTRYVKRSPPRDTAAVEHKKGPLSGRESQQALKSGRFTRFPSSLRALGLGDLNRVGFQSQVSGDCLSGAVLNSWGVCCGVGSLGSSGRNS